MGSVLWRVLTLFFVMVLVVPSVPAQPSMPDTVWTRWYGEGCITDLMPTPYGGLAMLVRDFGGVGARTLVRTDPEGDTVWTRRLDAVACKVLLTGDERLLLVGSVSGGIRLQLAEWNGDVGTPRVVPVAHFRRLTAAASCADGGLVIGGEAGSTSFVDYPVVVRLNADDSVEWVYRPPGPLYGDNTITAVAETADHNIFVCGTLGMGGPASAFVAVVDRSGSTVWMHPYAVGSRDWDIYVPSDVIQNADGHLVYLAEWNNGSVWKTFDGDGNLLWERNFEDMHQISRVLELPHGGYAVAGASHGEGLPYEQFSVWVLNDSADVQWHWMSADSMFYGSAALALAALSGGGFVAGGARWPHLGEPQRAFAVKVDYISETPEPQVAPLADTPRLTASPNPFNGRTILSWSLPRSAHTTVSVYDLLGRRVSTLLDQSLAAGAHQIPFAADGLAGGCYFVRLDHAGQSACHRIELLK